MENALKAGAWRSCITPPVGGHLAGHFRTVGFDRILDDLFVNALVLDDGSQRIALVSVDVCYIPHELLASIFEHIDRMAGIPRDRVMLTATHTHSGPILATSTVDMGVADEAYVAVFVRTLATAVAMAASRLRPVRVGVGRSASSRYSFNRRLVRPSDGQILMNWIEIDMIRGLRPSGPIDPELLVCRFDERPGVPLAILVNYALHNNAVMQPAISADLSGELAACLRKVYPDAVVLFLPGACGNVNWIDHADEHRAGRTDLYRRIGLGLAGTALDAMAGMEFRDVGSIGWRHEPIKVDERPGCGYDTREDDTFGNGPLRKAFFDGYRADRAQNEGRPLASYRLDLCALSLGREFAIASAPNELFTEIGREVKAASPFPFTMIAELTNGSMGYVPTRAAFVEGGYEVRKVMGGSFLEQGAADLITAASIRNLAALAST